MMHTGNFLQASAGRLLVTTPRTSDHCVHITVGSIAITSDSLTARQRFTINTFATSRAAAFYHKRKHTELGQYVQRDKMYKKVIAAHEPNTNHAPL